MDKSDEREAAPPHNAVQQPEDDCDLLEEVISSLNISMVSEDNLSCISHPIINVQTRSNLELSTFVSATDNVLSSAQATPRSQQSNNVKQRTCSNESLSCTQAAKRKREASDEIVKSNVSPPAPIVISYERDIIKAVNKTIAKNVSFDLLQNHNSDTDVPTGASTATQAELPPRGSTEMAAPSRYRTAAPLDATEGTQTPLIVPPEVEIIPKATPIWLLSKKHRAYEQRADLRSRLIEDLLKHSMVPSWALRQDYVERPPYIECTPAMLELTQRHAREVATQARDDLLITATEERERADDFLNIVQGIYVKEGNRDFFKAESRIVEIIARYGEQEKKKLSSSYSKDRDSFPADTAAWEQTMAATTRPSTSRPRRPRSGQRSPGGVKRRRTEADSSSSAPPPPPPPPPQAPASQAPRTSSVSGKGKAGSKGLVKGTSRRPDLPADHSAFPRAPPPQEHQSRGSRGGGPPRGRGRGRGAGYQNPRQEGSTFSTEDRALFEQMVRHFKDNK